MKLKIGSHVGMSGKDMLLGSAKEAYSYGIHGSTTEHPQKRYK